MRFGLEEGLWAGLVWSDHLGLWSHVAHIVDVVLWGNTNREAAEPCFLVPLQGLE